MGDMGDMNKRAEKRREQGMRISEIQISQNARVSLLRSKLRHSSYGLLLRDSANATVEDVSFLDHSRAAFRCIAECEKASLVTERITVMGKIWDTALRPPGGWKIEKPKHYPHMSRPGRPDSRWKFPEMPKAEPPEDLADDQELMLDSDGSELEAEREMASNCWNQSFNFFNNLDEEERKEVSLETLLSALES
mmetsp:Transcript_41368/g.64617  ORF Transcript_41368/g.64617 Transcript_41368/m.64617 type:complete len:193 (-) Transcript_41368:613-1191(-)|eukprot:CAMPEP_0184321178 /NCGR_PEP_ID=MMETSP1049-20130417/117680_1 /TAXON_ID=77928 /ORGANISM="Proteomonas sulcata, Strain CCMP704" /LENGTH=192 /DNA_ID=CAMNT_0026641893 /DNA_START=21 /DNA_END=599 /DNA_ORIENTATION=+